jgi:hypothetical protein
MKLSTITLAITAAVGVAQADNIRVGCRPSPNSGRGGTTMNEVIAFLHSHERGRTVPDLRYGWWDGKVQHCCDNQFNPGTVCGDIFTFAYNHPFPWANKQFQDPSNGKWIQCFKMGRTLSC